MRPYFWILLACFLWALDTLVRYPLVRRTGFVFDIILLEHLFISVMFITYYKTSFKKIWNGPLKVIFAVALLAIFGSALGTMSFSKAFLYLNPTVIILLQKLQPFFCIFWAYVVLKEKATRMYWPWFGVSIMGSILLAFEKGINLSSALDIQSWASTFSELGEDQVVGIILAMFSVLCWSLATVLGRFLILKGFDSNEIVFLRVFVAFIFLAVCKFYSGEALRVGFNRDLLLILFMSFISGFLALRFYYKGLKLTPAKLATLSELALPFFALVLNWAFLNARLSVTQVVGGVILLVSAFVVQWKKY